MSIYKLKSWIASVVASYGLRMEGIEDGGSLPRPLEVEELSSPVLIRDALDNDFCRYNHPFFFRLIYFENKYFKTCFVGCRSAIIKTIV